MRRFPGLFLLAAAVATSGCYHAVIETGRQPSGQTIQREWAHSFIAGLVPPSVTETAAACPNGVARVETQHSFLNMLAQFVTFSIYSPMTIEVQCASGDDNENDDIDTIEAARADAAAAMDEAVRRSAKTGEPVLVRLE